LKRSVLPQFVGKLVMCHLNTLPPQGSVTATYTAITCIVELKNLGAPSVATGWQFRFQKEGSDEIVLGPAQLSAKTMTMEHAGHRLQFVESDSILKKAMVPIPTGGMIQGFLQFLTPIPKEELAVSGAKMELSFRDVTDRTYFSSSTAKRFEPEQPIYFPGMETKMLSKKPNRPAAKVKVRNNPFAGRDPKKW
jgi:hypothetical protein